MALTGVRSAARSLDRQTPEDRERFADLIRVIAILVVVLGHWLAAVVLVDDDGRLVATQILVVEPWTRSVTWVVQVMPLFFLVGGRVNVGSLARARADGMHWSLWVRKRARRLLRPLLPLLAVWVPLGPVLAWLGVAPGMVELATETALIPLWFLVVYLLVIVLAPATRWLHERADWGAVVAAVVLIAVVDTVDRAGVPLVGEVNFLLVFGLAHQLGYFWAEDRLPTGRPALHIAWAGLAAAILLVAVLRYPLSMVGLEAGADSNVTPPTLALVALTTMQLGIVLAVRERAEAWLRAHPIPWAGVSLIGSAIITLFVWHMTALVVVASLTHLTGWWAGVTDVDARWWALRPVWVLLCTVVLLPLVLGFRTLEGAGDPVPGGPVPTVAGVAATAVGLNVVLTGGLYDADRPLGLPVLGLLALLVGLGLLGVHRRPQRAGGTSGR